MSKPVSFAIILIVLIGAGASYFVYSNYLSSSKVIPQLSCTEGTVLTGDTTFGAMAYDPANGLIYIAVGNNLTIVNASTNAIIGHITVGFPVATVGYDPANDQVYVGSLVFQNAVLDPATGKLTSLAFNATVPSQVSSFVPSLGAFYTPVLNDFEEVNATSDRMVAYYNLNQSIWDTAYDNATGLVYFADHSNDAILAVMPSSGRILYNISLGYWAGPSSLVVDPANGYLYVTDGGRSTSNHFVGNLNVTVINQKTRAIVATIYDLGAINLIYAQSNHDVYLTTPRNLVGIDSKTNAVVYNATYSSINNSTVSLPTGRNASVVNFPTGIMYDPKNSCLYVSGQFGVITVPTTE